MSIRASVDRVLTDWRLPEHGRLLSAFASSPSNTGAVAASSRELAAVLTGGMDLESAATVVELGAGTGVVTEAIEGRAGRRAVVLAFELNRDLADPLVERFPRFHIVNESAERLPALLNESGNGPADAIVSALPWASFSEERQDLILDAIVGSLKPGGCFATVAYLHASWLPAGIRFRRALGLRFGKIEESRVVWRNLPPAFVYHCS